MLKAKEIDLLNYLDTAYMLNAMRMVTPFIALKNKVTALENGIADDDIAGVVDSAYNYYEEVQRALYEMRANAEYLMRTVKRYDESHHENGQESIDEASDDLPF